MSGGGGSHLSCGSVSIPMSSWKEPLTRSTPPLHRKYMSPFVSYSNQFKDEPICIVQPIATWMADSLPFRGNRSVLVIIISAKVRLEYQGFSSIFNSPNEASCRLKSKFGIVKASTISWVVRAHILPIFTTFGLHYPRSLVHQRAVVGLLLLFQYGGEW